jgi:hypothetical protein
MCVSNDSKYMIIFISDDLKFKKPNYTRYFKGSGYIINAYFTCWLSEYRPKEVKKFEYAISHTGR